MIDIYSSQNLGKHIHAWYTDTPPKNLFRGTWRNNGCFRKVRIQEISNSTVPERTPTKTWVSNSSIATYWTGSVGIRSHLIYDGSEHLFKRGVQLPTYEKKPAGDTLKNYPPKYWNPEIHPKKTTPRSMTLGSKNVNFSRVYSLFPGGLGVGFETDFFPPNLSATEMHQMHQVNSV